VRAASRAGVGSGARPPDSVPDTGLGQTLITAEDPGKSSGDRERSAQKRTRTQSRIRPARRSRRMAGRGPSSGGHGGPAAAAPPPSRAPAARAAHGGLVTRGPSSNSGAKKKKKRPSPGQAAGSPCPAAAQVLRRRRGGGRGAAGGSTTLGGARPGGAARPKQDRVASRPMFAAEGPGEPWPGEGPGPSSGSRAAQCRRRRPL